MKKNLLLICTILFALNLTAAAQPTPTLVVPGNGTPPTLTPVTVNAGSGDQYDPHISGDWASYTSDISIRYYNFATNTDAAIPMGASARDLLSGISGSKIVFSRVITGKTTIMVFDAATAAAPIEIDPASGVTRIGSAIGGDTVAYIDFTLEGHGELVIHDLLTSTSVRVTNDTALDANPSVSLDGAVVTWEHCATSAANCDIWQAVKNGAVWDVAVSTATVNHEANPDTNGTLLVNDTYLPTSNGQIVWRPVTGGNEFQLQLPSIEANPSIAGNFISFESRPTLFDTTDMFVYDIVNNLLYQITNTPLVTEQLNDITVLPDGRIRVVWASDEDGFDQRNIKGATFSPAQPDNDPPVFTQPANIVANATMPNGAVVNYTVQATDNVGVVSLNCTPASGGIFAIGITAVRCTAGDAAGNTANATFSVRIKGAPEQIVDLIELARGMPLPTALKTKLLLALQTALANPQNRPLACSALSIFIQYVQSQPPSVIPPAKKAQMIADATRIKVVLACF